MTFFKSHQKLHIWLLADLVLLAAFWIAREHRDWMNALERFVSAPIRRSLGSPCYRVSFSVMEALYVLAAVLAGTRGGARSEADDRWQVQDFAEGG